VDRIQRAKDRRRGQSRSFVEERAVEVDLVDARQRPASVANGASPTAGYGPDNLYAGQGAGHTTERRAVAVTLPAPGTMTGAPQKEALQCKPSPFETGVPESVDCR
jgi:hypothetical protein